MPTRMGFFPPSPGVLFLHGPHLRVRLSLGRASVHNVPKPFSNPSDGETVMNVYSTVLRLHGWSGQVFVTFRRHRATYRETESFATRRFRGKRGVAERGSTVTLVVVLDIIVLFPLAWAFHLLWRERRKFRSLLPIIVSVVFLFVARLCEVLVEHPTMHIFRLFGFPREPYAVVITVTGGFAEVLGVLFLVTGFVQTIRARRAQEKIIHELESLLPICSGCKKYKARDGTWQPIEKYLLNSGSAEITHGLCPDCSADMREEIKHLTRQNHKASVG